MGGWGSQISLQYSVARTQKNIGKILDYLIQHTHTHTHTHTYIYIY